MQRVVESFRESGKIFKKMQEVSPKELGIRNKIKIYIASDIKGRLWAVFAVSQKSRLLMKDVYKFEEIYAKLCVFYGNECHYKTLFIDAPLCSKAKKAFQEAGWKLQ